MKGKIDKQGALWLKRGKEELLQRCPYRSKNASCGDWCPLFGEPDYEYMAAHALHSSLSKPINVKLKLCRTELLFDPSNFEDQRKKSE